MATSTFAATRDKFENLPEVNPVETPATPSEPAAAPVVENISIPTPDTAPVEPSSEVVVPEVVQDDATEFSLNFDTPEQPIESKPTVPSFNLDEELKKIDKRELLKKAGVNDFVIDFENHIANGGNPVDYLQAKAIDYTKVSDEDLIKSDLKRQYPNLTSQQIDLMFNRTYGVTEDALEEDKEFAMAKLAADGYRVRQTKIEEQQKFKIADPISVTNPEYEEWKQLKDNQQKIYEQNINFFNNHSATKSLNESKKVVISVGEDVKPFNFKLNNPELITKAMTDDGTIMQKLLSTETGEPDVAKQQLVTLFAFNPKGFIQAIFDYGASMGTRKKLVDENQNAQRPSTPVLPISPDAKPVFRNSTFGQVRNG